MKHFKFGMGELKFEHRNGQNFNKFANVEEG